MRTDMKHADGHRGPGDALADKFGSNNYDGPGNTVAEHQTNQQVQTQQNGIGRGPQIRSTSGQLEVLCGPLLNYRRMSREHTDSPVWHGSVLIVTMPGNVPDLMTLSCVGAAGNSNGMTNGHSGSQDSRIAVSYTHLTLPTKRIV